MKQTIRTLRNTTDQISVGLEQIDEMVTNPDVTDDRLVSICTFYEFW